MEIKTYKTKNKNYPWRAEDSNGNFVDAVTKDAAINMLRSFYDESPVKKTTVADDALNKI